MLAFNALSKAMLIEHRLAEMALVGSECGTIVTGRRICEDCSDRLFQVATRLRKDGGYAADVSGGWIAGNQMLDQAQ